MYPDDGQYLRFFPVFAEAFGGIAFTRGDSDPESARRRRGTMAASRQFADEDALGALIEQSVEERKKADLAAVLEQMDRYHPKEPHWHLALIGVTPSHQGEGYGSAMMELELAECDRAGLPSYLEATSPRSVPLYERHGFRVLGEIRVGDCPPITPMLRPARSR